MSEPIVASKEPYVMKVDAGTHAWCACGRSANQPFCDGSHDGTGIEPVLHQVDEPTTVAFCGCKQTQNPPLCDGSHTAL